MDNREYRRLALMKQLLEVAATRFAALADGQDHPRIDTARKMIEVSGVTVTRVAGGISAWRRTWLQTLEFAVAAWTVATISGPLIGMSAGWTITVTVVAMIGLAILLYKQSDALVPRVNRWRTKRSEPPTEVRAPADLDPAEEVLWLLWRTRDGLAGEMRRRSAAHRFGYVARTAAGFDWLRRRDTSLFYLSHADRIVCQAICSIEIWLNVTDRDR